MDLRLLNYTEKVVIQQWWHRFPLLFGLGGLCGVVRVGVCVLCACGAYGFSRVVTWVVWDNWVWD